MRMSAGRFLHRNEFDRGSRIALARPRDCRSKTDPNGDAVGRGRCGEIEEEARSRESNGPCVRRKIMLAGACNQRCSRCTSGSLADSSSAMILLAAPATTVKGTVYGEFRSGVRHLLS